MVLTRQNEETPLVRDLRARLAELEARGPAHPHPETKPVMIGKPSNETENGFGQSNATAGVRPPPMNRKIPPSPTQLPRGVAGNDPSERTGAGPSAEQIAKAGGVRMINGVPEHFQRRFGPFGRR